MKQYVHKCPRCLRFVVHLRKHLGSPICARRVVMREMVQDGYYPVYSRSLAKRIMKPYGIKPYEGVLPISRTAKWYPIVPALCCSYSGVFMYHYRESEAEKKEKLERAQRYIEACIKDKNYIRAVKLEAEVKNVLGRYRWELQDYVDEWIEENCSSVQRIAAE